MDNFYIGDTVNYWFGKKEGKPTGRGTILQIAKSDTVRVAKIQGLDGFIPLSKLEKVVA